MSCSRILFAKKKKYSEDPEFALQLRMLPALAFVPKDDVIKFSMEFTNRSHNHKKQWLHGRGSQGGFTPTYFSVTGIRGT